VAVLVENASETSPGHANDVRLSLSRVGAYACGVGAGVGVGADAGSGGDPKDDGWGFFSAGWGNGHEGVGIKILEVSFVKVRHKPVYLLTLCLRLLTGLVPFVRAGQNGTSSAWSRATELQAVPWRVCCGVWGCTGICSRCCHIWCSWWADELRVQC